MTTILLGSYRLLNLAKRCLHDPPQRAFGCGDAVDPGNQASRFVASISIPLHAEWRRSQAQLAYPSCITYLPGRVMSARCTLRIE